LIINIIKGKHFNKFPDLIYTLLFTVEEVLEQVIAWRLELAKVAEEFH